MSFDVLDTGTRHDPQGKRRLDLVDLASPKPVPAHFTVAKRSNLGQRHMKDRELIFERSKIAPKIMILQMKNLNTYKQ